MKTFAKHGIILLAIFTFLLVVLLETSLAQKMSTFEGSVAAITTRFKKGVISVKGNKGEIINFAVGIRTVYVPSRYPGVGERVKITYSLQRGQNAAYTVEILSTPEAPPPKNK